MPPLTIQEEESTGCLVRDMNTDLDQWLTMLAGPPTHDLQRRQVSDTPIEQVLQHSPPTPMAPNAPSPFVVKTPADLRVTKRKRRSIVHLLALFLALTLLS